MNKKTRSFGGMCVVFGTLNPSRWIDRDSIRGLAVVVQGCRLAPKGRLNVIKGVCGLFQIDKNILKPACMKNLDLGVREH